MATATAIRKISVKNVCETVPVPKDRTLMMRVWGVVYGTRVAKTSFGESVGFKGSFGAINLATGEEFVSPEFFPPSIVELMLLPAVKEAGGDGVQFAFDIGVAPNERAATKYEYYAYPLFGEERPNSLLDTLKAALPALPAPTHATPAPEEPTSEDAGVDGSEPSKKARK